VTSVAEARVVMLAAVRPVGEERVALGAAQGHTLASPIIALRDQPPFAASAMDGYALRASDAPGVLRMVGEAAAGHAFARALQRGEAVRISTGAPMPAGADVVLIQEEARLEGDMLLVAEMKPGRHVRPAACDFARGAVLLESGRRLDAAAVALAAACGAATVTVARRPRVAILGGGDELATPGTSPRPDQIFDSCSYGVAALVERCGGVAICAPLLPDDPDLIADAAAAAIRTSDLVAFIGSASVGPHDHARAAFERLGARFLVRKVDMRPGKPTWFATTPGAAVLGLPGNPASALVASALFLAPLLGVMQGRSGETPACFAKLAHAVPANGPREAFLRATVSADGTGQLSIDASRDQDSSLLSVFTHSNALLVRAPHAPAAAAGVTVSYIEWQG